jgi:hypothetical protein
MRKRVYLPSPVDPTIRPDSTTNPPLVQKEESVQNLMRAKRDEEEEFVTSDELDDWRGKHNSLSRGTGADGEMMLPHRHSFICSASPA